ncbi:MAG: hypothetical protein HYY64_15530 [Candidatus Rokubacteria bacterium]|nr:hypothetical protein [Candidatus Rokubacteria bacterium]
MTLQGWVPEIGEFLTLAEVIDLAFDYRGNTTVVRVDGTEIEGYVFNRNRDAPEPFIQIFDVAGNGPIRIPCSEIRNIRFTGRDMAAGNSWQAWLERREREKAEKAGPA